MKKIMLIPALLLCMAAMAQENEKANIDIVPAEKTYNKEIGIFNQMAYENGVNMAGIQFKKWKDEHRGFRFMAAYGGYDLLASSTYAIRTDTLLKHETRTKINMGVIGAGIEMQRHFYKTFSMYAAIELRGGYGSGYIDTAVVREYKDKVGFTNQYDNSFTRQNVNMFYLGASPSVGIKAQRKHWGVGIELTPLNIMYKSITQPGSSQNLLEFNAGMFEQRMCVSYRF